MGTIDAIGISYLDPAVSRALVPVQPATNSDNSNNQRQPTPSAQSAVPTGAQRSSLETRADVLQQRVFSDGNTPNRTLNALKAYQSLNDDKEREQISQLLGVDEYA